MTDRAVRLVALDIDGTLVDDDLVLGSRTQAAVAEAARRGIAVALVTGRMAASALPFARALRLRTPIVAQQGALIRAMPEPDAGRVGRLLFHRPIPPDVATDITRWAFDRGYYPHFNYLERLIAGADDPRVEEFRAFVGDRVTVVDDVVERAQRPVTKIVLVGGEEGHPLELLDEARSRFDGRATVTLSHPRFLEFLAAGISKGYGIRWLARRLRVPLSETLAIGDQYNDLEMIAEAGYGVAMPTAPDAVAAVATYIAPPVEDEGAAQMIEQLALGGALPEVALHVPEAMRVAERRMASFAPITVRRT